MQVAVAVCSDNEIGRILFAISELEPHLNGSVHVVCASI